MASQDRPLAAGRRLPERDDPAHGLDRRDDFPIGVEGEGDDDWSGSPSNSAGAGRSARPRPRSRRSWRHVAADDKAPIGREGHATDVAWSARQRQQLGVAEPVEVEPLESAAVGAIGIGGPVVREAPA